MRLIFGFIIVMTIGFQGMGVSAQAPFFMVDPDLLGTVTTKPVFEETQGLRAQAPKHWPFALPRRKPEPGAFEIVPDLPLGRTARSELTRTAFLNLKRNLMQRWPVALRGAAFIKEQGTLRHDNDRVVREKAAGFGSTLFQFYLAHGLYPEALAILPYGTDAYSEIDDAEDRAAILVALFGAGRYAEIAAMGDSTPEVANTPYAAAALTALGRYQAADQRFQENDQRAPVFFAEEICLWKAETRLMLEKDPMPSNCPQGQAPSGVREFVVAGEAVRAQPQAMTDEMELNADDKSPALARVRILSLRKRFDLGTMPAGKIAYLLADLISQYPASMVARDGLSLYADVTAFDGNFAASLNASRRLMVYYPASDAAKRAVELGRKTLDQLLRSQDTMPAFELAALVYENIDWLEPGGGGDAQIRILASRLVDLDLIREATELLDHQISHRLTGAERAERAVHLAALYLEDKREKDALRILNDTRQTGLGPAVQQARRHVEARALWALGKHDQALARLEVADEIALPSQTLLLRARIQFDTGNAQAAFPTLYRQALRQLQNRDRSREAEIDIAMAFAAAMASDNTTEAAQLAQFTNELWPSSDLSRLLQSFQYTGEDGAVPVDFVSAFSQWMAGKQASIEADTGPDEI